MEIAPEVFLKEPNFSRSGMHQPPFSPAFMTDAASGFENTNKCCKVCKRRISTQVTVEQTLCDSGNETKSTTHFLSAETNSVGRKEPERKHKIDYRWKDIGSLVTALNRLSSALAKSECSHELAAGTQGEPQVSEYLFKEASDAIRCVKLCLLGLQNGSKSLEQHTTREDLIESIIQGELSDVMNSFVSNTVSANPFIHGNALVTAGTGLSLNEIKCSEESLQQGIDGRYEKAMPLHQVPSKAISWPVEMNVPYPKGMGSQVIDRASGRDSGPYAPFQIGNPCKEEKPGGWMPDNKVESIKGETEPRYKTTMQNYPMPSCKFVARGLLPYNEEMLPANSAWFPCQTNDQSHETRIEYQAIPDDKFKRSGARKLFQQPAVLKEYRMNQRVNQESGTDSKLSRTLRARNKNSFPSRTKQQTLIDNHPDDFTMPLTSSKWKDNNVVGFHRFNDRKHPRGKILQHKHDPDDKYTDSSSSHRRNQESSGSISYAAEGFHTPHNWSQNYVTSTASSESEMFSPLPSWGETLSSHVSDEDYEQTSSRTSYGNEEYSLTSRATSDEVSLSDDSEGYGLSSHGQTRQLQHHKKPRYLSIDSASDRIGLTRKSKLPKVMNLKKHGGGAWKKLKDKLSIIFHHHHHHHHHHHRPTRGDDKDHSTHDIRTKHGKQAVDKVEKSIIKAGGTRKDEHKHLSSLVGALFRHIRHKKKSKSNASNIKRLGKGKHGAKNVWKKKH